MSVHLHDLTCCVMSIVRIFLWPSSSSMWCAMQYLKHSTMEVTITALSDGLVDALSLERLRPKKTKHFYNTVTLKGNKRNASSACGKKNHPCMRDVKKVVLKSKGGSVTSCRSLLRRGIKLGWRALAMPAPPSFRRAQSLGKKPFLAFTCVQQSW